MLIYGHFYTEQFLHHFHSQSVHIVCACDRTNEVRINTYQTGAGSFELHSTLKSHAISRCTIGLILHVLQFKLILNLIFFLQQLTWKCAEWTYFLPQCVQSNSLAFFYACNLHLFHHPKIVSLFVDSFSFVCLYFTFIFILHLFFLFFFFWIKYFRWACSLAWPSSI